MSVSALAGLGATPSRGTKQALVRAPTRPRPGARGRSLVRLSQRRVSAAEVEVATPADVAAPADAADDADVAAPRHGPESTVIVGGGPSGLSTALMLARRGWTGIKVWERLARPDAPDSGSWANPERSYNIGVSSRGQRVLASLDVLPRMERYAAVVRGRKDWTPENPDGKERLPSNRSTTTYLTKTIQRDRLTACLLEEIEERHAGAIEVEFGAECESVAWEGEKVSLNLRHQDGSTDALTADLLIGADGVSGIVPQAMAERGEGGFKITAMKDRPGAELVYKTVRVDLPDDMRSDLNYSVRLPSGITLEMLPTKEGSLIGVLLHKPGEREIEDLDTAEKAMAYFKQNFPQFSEHVADEEYALFARRRASRLPKFQYTGPTIVAGGNTALLGDAIHTVKPYFGLGVNAAFEDVSFLEASLDAHDDALAPALREYSARRAKDAKAVVEMSHTLDGGFLKFVLPLIIDGIFHKLAPAIFMPNTIQMLQREQWTFDDVRKRKRLDRFMQAAVIVPILSSLAVSLFFIVREAIRFMLKMVPVMMSRFTMA